MIFWTFSGFRLKQSWGRCWSVYIYRPPNALTSWMDYLADNLGRVEQESMLVAFMGDLNCNLLKPDSQVTKSESITSEFDLTQMEGCPGTPRVFNSKYLSFFLY